MNFNDIGPEVVKAALMFLFGGGLVSLWKARQADKNQKMQAGHMANEQVVEITEQLQRLAATAVSQANLDLTAIREEMAATRKHVSHLESYQRDCSGWHVDHVENFDTPARLIIARSAPDELGALVLRPFPKWEDVVE